MRDMRKHKRFKLDVIDLSSKMSIVGKVDIIDISVSGIALKADRKLNIGKEYLMTLGYGGNQITVKGTVVRSELSGIEERPEGEKVTVYSAGLLFKNEAGDKVQNFLDSIDTSKKTPVTERIDWFYRDVKFSITTPSEKVLNLLSQFGVKEISRSGIIIQTDRKLKIGSMVLMELSVKACEPASFMGKVVSCRAMQDKENEKYDIGVEFSELTDRDRSLVKSFIECVKDKNKVSAANTSENRKD